MQYPLTQYTEARSKDGVSMVFGITDPESFANPPDTKAFREMIERRIPDGKDPDRVTAYHLLKWYEEAMRQLEAKGG